MNYFSLYMSFGIYAHIPYCIQRCTYCDFATYEQSQILAPEKYIELLLEEIQQKAHCFEKVPLSTLYFGGGTPSLIDPMLIKSVIRKIHESGFDIGPATEITIEINPATISEKKMEAYLEMGVNRFSVGAQTFNNELLKSVNREHSAEQTRETLKLLKSYKVNYSFDILFALPGQTLAGLKKDLEEVLFFKPNHVSPYCLTVTDEHVLAKRRLPEDLQLDMFSEINSVLTQNNYTRYEISNYALPGFESQHNSLYWDDQPYWGIGLSSHSFAKVGDWGARFWNPRSINEYEKLILAHRQKSLSTVTANLPVANYEYLKFNQAVSDFCHTSLRREVGLSKQAFSAKFSESIFSRLLPILKSLESKKMLKSHDDERWNLTENGILVSNQIFEKFTFLENELAQS